MTQNNSTRKRLRICHVITRMIIGGAQENTLLSVIGQYEKGHDVTLITGPSLGPEGDLLKQRKLPPVKIVNTPYLVRKIAPVCDIRAYFFLKEFFCEKKFDIVHTHSSKAGIIGRIAAWEAGIPVIVHTIHGQAFHRYEKAWKNTLYKSAEKYAARYCHKIFAVAQAMIDQCVAAGIAPPNKYKVVYSGMELEQFLDAGEKERTEIRKKFGIPINAPVIGTIARLFPLKGYEFFMPAAERIASELPEIRFLIVGNGIMREKLEAIAKEKKLNMVFAGLVPPSEIYKYISAMDILLHLSLREGLPRAVVQCLASGKPAVGFALDGTPEVIIHNETGILAEPENINEVVTGAIDLLRNHEKRCIFGEKGRELVKQKFDWRKMVDILEEEYYNLSTEKPPSEFIT